MKCLFGCITDILHDFTLQCTKASHTLGHQVYWDLLQHYYPLFPFFSSNMDLHYDLDLNLQVKIPTNEPRLYLICLPMRSMTSYRYLDTYSSKTIIFDNHTTASLQLYKYINIHQCINASTALLHDMIRVCNLLY